jgi:hypothetical protein
MFNRHGTMRALHAEGKKHGYDHEALHELAASLFRMSRDKVSIAKLTNSQLATMLIQLKGNAPGAPMQMPSKLTSRQAWKIHQQAAQLGWTDPARLAGFLERQTGHTCKVEDLTPSEAPKVIDGLKALITRGACENPAEGV